MGPRIKLAGGSALLATIMAAILLAGGPGGGGGEPTPTPTATATPGVGVANLWVDTNGGTCTRQSTAGAWSDAGGCSSFAAARTAASSGDVIRVKTGTYGRQGGIGSASKSLWFIGENGATIDSGAGGAAYDTLSLSGNVILDNVDVTGDAPIVQLEGTGNQWTNSRLDQKTAAIRPCNGDEPLLIQDGEAATGTYPIDGNTIGPYLTIGPFKGQATGCAGNGYLHLEQVRLGRGARNITFDRVTFEACPEGSGYVGCGSGHLFITNCCSGAGSPPTGITVRNSRFLGAEPFAMQAGAQMSHNGGWVFAYNFFKNSPLADDGSVTGITFVGNAGPRAQNCTSGYTWTKNVWQHSLGTACGTDLRVSGPNDEVGNLGVNSSGVTQSGSVLINAGQATSCSAANNQDFDGDPRPTGAACDAGPDEIG